MTKLVHKKRRSGRKKGGGRTTFTAAQLAAKRRKIEALRQMTVERGCTPDEAANARARVKELEAQVARAEAEAGAEAAAAVKEAARGRRTRHRAVAAPVDPNSCAARVGAEYAHEMEHLREVWEGYQSGGDDDEKVEAWDNYGLSFDYVAPGTFTGQREGYFRYQISWGGPSDEFRFYVRREDYPARGRYGNVEYRTRFVVGRVEYWFMDWFDGAKVDVTGSDLDLLKDVFNWFDEVGSASMEYEKAMADADFDGE